MKVILTQNVARLGNKGDIVEVSEGYARNFLLKKNLAREATKGALKDTLNKKETKEKAKDEAIAQKLILAKKLKEEGLVLNLNKNKSGQLFEKIDKAKLVKIIKEKYGVNIKEGEIVFEDTVKSVGDFEFGLKIAGNKFEVDLKIE